MNKINKMTPFWYNDIAIVEWTRERWYINICAQSVRWFYGKMDHIFCAQSISVLPSVSLESMKRFRSAWFHWNSIRQGTLCAEFTRCKYIYFSRLGGISDKNWKLLIRNCQIQLIISHIKWSNYFQQIVKRQ